MYIFVIDSSSIKHHNPISNTMPDEKWKVRYTNYKDITSTRHILIENFFVGSTSYHPRTQVLINVIDLDKNEKRVFAASSVLEWIERL